MELEIQSAMLFTWEETETILFTLGTIQRIILTLSLLDKVARIILPWMFLEKMADLEQTTWYGEIGATGQKMIPIT